MKPGKIFFNLLLFAGGISCFCAAAFAQTQKAGVPDREELSKPFSEQDKAAFRSPAKVHYPETWFHYIGGNVSLKGITADLEQIAAAGISGVQLFHGQFGGPWPGVDKQIACLSPLWDNAVRYTAEECKRLGLRFTMQNCPGWAMSGGPWIQPSNAMRHLVWSRTDVEARTDASIHAVLDTSQSAHEDWRDYQDIVVLAFPTPLEDTGSPLQPTSIIGSDNLSWDDCLDVSTHGAVKLAPTSTEQPYWVELTFPEAVQVRTIELPSINSLNHSWCYEPGVQVTAQALSPEGSWRTVMQLDLPAASWQDDYPLSIACSEVEATNKYRLSIVNQHEINLGAIRFYTAARKNSWESEAGWTLRAFERTGADVAQSAEAYIGKNEILDITPAMSPLGELTWQPPHPGKWTILRVGHVNTGQRNAPAPPEGTGWECDKLSEAGPNAHFAGYIGRLANGPLNDGLLNGMLLDSWECRTQTWTPGMEKEFERVAGYSLKEWLPAVFGYVIEDPETTGRFLLDWRSTIGDLFANKFYGRMAELAKENNLTIAYETAAGDVFPADILEFFKYADIPMCEFWHPLSDNYVGSLNFKPIKPTASAAHVYGKPRVAAEAFTSFNLTWDERWEMLKEVANVNIAQGVTHLVFHTYTHNPRTDFLPPGTSFGSNIGTPFLRGQTWWKHMPEFTSYLARCSYLLERGNPVADVLWYLGDEISHKPDQNAAFPTGYKYDYCNPDVLLNRLQVHDGRLVTPEGIAYSILWIPDSERMRPETLEKLNELILAGAKVVAEAPKGLATLRGGSVTEERFNLAVEALWGDQSQSGIRKLGKGYLFAGIPLEEALNAIGCQPDVRGGEVMWVHRQTEGADWYFVAAPQGKAFGGILDFHADGQVELWDPVTGDVTPVEGNQQGAYTSVKLSLPKSAACFVVFRPAQRPEKWVDYEEQVTPIHGQWTLAFPAGWGAPATLQLSELKPWKDLDLSAEGKAFSGTATYTTTFSVKSIKKGMRFSIDLGTVDMIATVSLNGKLLRTLWAPPYSLDVTDAIQKGENQLTVEVTSTWFNRLVYDAGLPEAERKTWTINGPRKESPLRNSGLTGPVVLSSKTEKK